MNARWKIEMFGGLSARQDDRVVTQFRTYKTGVLLAYLAYHADRAHPREALIALLWPDSDLEQGRPSLSVALSSLRHQLEPPGVPAGAVLIANRATVQLNPASCETDTVAFYKALEAAAHAESAAKQAQWISDAVRLYRGEFLPGYYEDWCLIERERLAQRYQQALRQWVKYLAETRDFPRALEVAQLAARADPLREEAHRDLMRLYIVNGRPSAALQHFRELEQRLREETGAVAAASDASARTRITERLAQFGEMAVPEEENLPQIPRPVALPGPAAPMSLTVATFTFLLTDIADTQTLREQAGEAYTAALAAHCGLLRREFARHGGQEIRTTGEGFLVAFARATDALACAEAGQRACASYVWPVAITVPPMRMALHTGELGAASRSARSGLDSTNPVVDLATRILLAAHGGQILCSAETAALLHRGMEAEMRLIDLGLYRLHGSEGVERLFEVRRPGRPQVALPPPDLERATTNHLPLQCTRFFGRQTEMAHLMDLLSGIQADFTGAVRNPQTRLVTLTGPGGTGKTRLALEVANRLHERFQGAVWFVPLVELTDADRILEAVVDAMHLSRASDAEPVEQIARSLAGRPALIVLDNFEQLVETGSSVVGTLLGRVPTMTCLVTSRQMLNLTGEREFRVTPLPIPPGTGTPEQLSLYESVQLFLDRAQTVKPDFQVTHANAPAIAELCARLEGIPLAIELAASRAQVLTPGQMLVQLEHRFDFLVSRKRDVAVRHRTLRAAVDWSYQLLTPELRRFFARLSIFRGGWSLAAAEAVCMEPLALDHLAQLHECSLLQTEEESRTSYEIRFRMLESLREYSAEQLTPEERIELAGRHAATYLALAQEADAALRGPDQMRWLDRLTVEYDNLRAALQWNIDHGEVEAGLSLGAALGRFWLIRGHLREGLNWLSRLLAQSGTVRSAGPRGHAFMAAAWLAVALADYPTALSYYEESLRIMREIGDRVGTGRILQGLGLIAWYQGDDATARARYEESLQIMRQLGGRPEISNVLGNLAILMHKQGDYAAARALLDESLAIRREVGDTWGIASALGNLGVVVRDQGDIETAQAFQKESLILWQQLGDKRSTAESLEMLSGTATAQAQFGRAVQLLAAADRLRETTQTPAAPNARADHEIRLAEARRAMGESAYSVAHAEGRAMTLEQALAYALERG